MKCNTSRGNFQGGFKARALPGTVVDQVLNLTHLLVCNLTKVGAFWQVPSHQAMVVFTGCALPGVIGVGEVAFGMAGGGDILMSGILGSVVQGQGSSALFRESL